MGVEKSEACSCLSPFVFLKHLEKNSVVAHVEVIRHQELPITDIEEGMRIEYFQKYPSSKQDSSFTPFIFVDVKSITWLRVVRWIENSMQQDTLIFANREGGMCGANISSLNVGKQFILNGFLSALNFPNVDDLTKVNKLAPLIASTSGFPTIGADLCTEWGIWIEGDNVKGNITKNRLAESYPRYFKVSKYNPERARKILNRHRARATSQVFSYSKVISMIYRKMRRLQQSSARVNENSKSKKPE